MTMTKDDEGLIHCFASVFPSAERDEILTANFEAISGWDSLRGVMLLAILDEEFGAQIDLSELLELGTFEGLKQFLLQRGSIT